MDLVSHARKPYRVRSRTSANIIDHRRSAREKTPDEFLRPLELELAPNRREPGFLSSDSRVMRENFGTDRRLGSPHHPADATYFDIASEASRDESEQIS
jgi:hypothetical protein